MAKKTPKHTYAFITIASKSHVAFRTDGGYSGSEPILRHEVTALGRIVQLMLSLGVETMQFRRTESLS